MDVNQLLEQLNDSQACSKQMHEQYTNATRLFHTTQTKVVEVANCLLEKLQDMNVDVREHYKHVDGSDGYNKRTSGFRSLESLVFRSITRISPSNKVVLIDFSSEYALILNWVPRTSTV